MPYCGPAPDPAEWFFAWNMDPVLILCLAIFATGGAVHLRMQMRGRQQAFGVAIFVAILAFVSPLCALSVALFSARTLHHLVVMGALAPALAMALPWRSLPVVPSVAALSAALWLWHIPPVYSAAWDSALVYWGMQAALILPAWLFWTALLEQRSLPNVVWLVTLMAQMGLLGAVLTFAPRAFYLEHLTHAERFGLSALEDQQLAGLVMWVPGMVPLAVVAAIMGWRVLQQDLRA